MDRQARRYSTTPAQLLGVEPGTWAAVLVDTACRLSGLGEFDVAVSNLQQKQAFIVMNVPMTGGL
jgi:hypothetical protein